MRGDCEHDLILRGLNREAQRLAFAWYLRRGRVPARIKVILEATASRETFAKYSADQPRVPAGHPDGGQWTDGGGGGANRKPQTSGGLRKVLDKKTKKRAEAIYGETSGLTPQLLNPKRSVYDPKNWNSDSAKKLHRARIGIGIVSERNPKVNYAEPSDPNNAIQAQTWSLAVDAGISAGDDTALDPRVTHFFLRQRGTGRQTPPWPELTRYYSMGPFNNVGGGDVPKGPNTYIDFYGK